MTTTSPPATNPTTWRPLPDLLVLLDDELRFSPSFRGTYSSHLAMAMVALDQLGASVDALERAFERHATTELEPRTDTDELAARLEEVERDGIAQVVRCRVSDLVAAPATALFHPMIRLAYALDVGHQGQVAAALLDWENRYDRLPVEPPNAGSQRLTDVAERLAVEPAGTWERSFGLAAIATTTELRRAVDGLALDGATIDDIVRFALVAHATADDFITLHMVTGARAAHALIRWLDRDSNTRLGEHLALAMAVAYAAVGAPPLLDDDQLERLRLRSAPSTDAIAQRAVASVDPHVIKLVNVALVEETRTGDPLYRYLAARAVGLTDDLA